MIPHNVKPFTLWEFVKAHWLTLRYVFEANPTINYPYEKKAISSRFRSNRLIRLGVIGPILCVAGAAAAEQADQVELLRFECSVALLMQQQQFSAPTPVTIHFTRNGRNLSAIRVVDEGGILYPGGNMRVVQRPDAVALEAVAMPPERPGTWTGRVDRNMYRLTLASGRLAEAVVIGLGRSPSSQSGRYGLVWNATNQVENMPRPLSGTGGGNCARADANGGAE